ncbi:type IV pilus modification protein PilV [Rhodoferax sp.]|uniref:type IV pilus modification protein PilV n=1 Tax=Rhodoferax sp. TaxID=50421 RepID=UPI00374D2133
MESPPLSTAIHSIKSDGSRIAVLRAKGFSLLEVLISIIILSFGLLGMVGLQATALQSNREARLQSTAATLARELAEMMRGNKAASQLPTGNPYLQDFTTAAPTTEAHCLDVSSSTNCGTDTTAVANSELTEWLARVSTELPGARVNICVDAAPFDSNGIPQWSCTAGTGATTVIKIGWTRGSTNRSSSNTTLLEKATVPSIVFPVTAGNT